MSAVYIFYFLSCFAPASEIDLRSTLLPLLSLLTSSIILYLGIGLMNVLVPVRMGLEGMATDTIGMVL